MASTTNIKGRVEWSRPLEERWARILRDRIVIPFRADLPGGLQILPVAADNGNSDGGRAFTPPCHLIGKKGFLHTDLASRGMISRIAVQQTAVTHAIAPAITGLLSQHGRYLFGDAVRSCR